MGTTQRIGNGVKNEPNWGNLSISVTSAAKAIEEIAELDSEEENKTNQVDPVQFAKEYKKLETRRDNNIKKSLRRLVDIGGGSKNISTGKSNKIGRAGLKSSAKLVSFFVEVGKNGLGKTLDNIGFGSLVGKTVKDVIEFITNFCCDSDIGMDEAASKEAMCEVLKNLSLEANEDIDSLEALMQTYTDNSLLSNLLCDFFGVYIYEYLWERLEERLRQIRGVAVAKATFDSIKKEIMGRVLLLNSTRPIAQINWSGNEGIIEIEKTFEAIIKIEGE